MSRRHRYNLAKLNAARPWFFADHVMAKQQARHRDLYRAEKKARTLDKATGADALTGHALNLAVIECMTIHVQPPVPFPGMQDDEFLDGKTFDEVLADESLKAAWEARYRAASIAWTEAHGKNQGVTWGWLRFQKVETPSRADRAHGDYPRVTVPSYFVTDEVIDVGDGRTIPCQHVEVFHVAEKGKDAYWAPFNPAVDKADALEVFEAGSYDIHGGGNLSWDADCFDLPEWHCTFSGGFCGREAAPAGINGWGDTMQEAICRAYVHKHTTVAVARVRLAEARRKKDAELNRRLFADW